MNRGRLERALASAYAPLMSGLAMGAIGALGLATGQTWLFPSLGPTVFLQTVTPGAPGARAWNTIAGHAIGLCAGFGALFFCGADAVPAAMGGELLSLARVEATALAVAATVGAQSLLKAKHPPAAATTMLITLGGLQPTWRTVASISAGVLLISVIGAIIRIWPRQRDAF